jgi:hypothetical protein
VIGICSASQPTASRTVYSKCAPPGHKCASAMDNLKRGPQLQRCAACRQACVCATSSNGCCKYDLALPSEHHQSCCYSSAEPKTMAPKVPLESSRATAKTAADTSQVSPAIFWLPACRTSLFGLCSTPTSPQYPSNTSAVQCIETIRLPCIHTQRSPTWSRCSIAYVCNHPVTALH